MVSPIAGSVEALLRDLQSRREGLSTEEARSWLSQVGPNVLVQKKEHSSFKLFLKQFASPTSLILLFAAALSGTLSDPSDAIIILVIVFFSAFLSFWQERGAKNIVEKLLKQVRTDVVVLRDGKEEKIDSVSIVPGDIILLSAGTVIPADCRLITATDLFVDEVTLTGEAYPVDKQVIELAENTPLAQQKNMVFAGTHVVSGTARALVVRTGKDSEFGKIAGSLKKAAPETDFEKGVRRFGYLLMEVTLILLLLIFAFNVYLHKPVLDSFLFALALAVGLTPQLLPAIISVNLAKGAERMAQNAVVVKRLASIENLGSMNVLCADKTGTLTEGVVHIRAALDYTGEESEEVLRHAYLNAYFESGYVNPIDEALRNNHSFDTKDYTKVDEIPYDFDRKRLTILLNDNDSSKSDEEYLMITKGALEPILQCCSTVKIDHGVEPLTDKIDSIREHVKSFNESGYRVLGVAVKRTSKADIVTKDEQEMIFLGILTFEDPIKADATQSIEALRGQGVELKIITGDSVVVARHILQSISRTIKGVMTGAELRQLSDHALKHRINSITLFAEIEPSQKERIIRLLRTSGNVVGYLGDGINDALALHAADVSISVDSAADVAKQAADIVLMHHSLQVLRDGVEEGRRTFGNTLKYIFMASSANFGNMFSMAGASLFLPFLPLLPKQVLMTNLLTDLSEMTIASDNVDRDLLAKPRHWNLKFIRQFMVVFGLLSSLFDYLTFGVLLLVLDANMNQFRTGWFTESIISASMIVLVIRTRQPFYKSKPSKYLQWAIVGTAVLTLLLPYTPLGYYLGLLPMPTIFYLWLGGILLLYVLMAELVKKAFFRYVRGG